MPIRAHAVITLALTALVFIASGCTYRDPSIDLLEGELRWMEDQLFMLEDAIDTRDAEIAKYRQTQYVSDTLCESTPPPMTTGGQYEYDDPSQRRGSPSTMDDRFHRSRDSEPTRIPDRDRHSRDRQLDSDRDLDSERRGTQNDWNEDPSPPSIDLPPSNLQSPQRSRSQSQPNASPVDIPPSSSEDELMLEEPSIELPPSTNSGSRGSSLKKNSAGDEYQIIEPSVELPSSRNNALPSPPTSSSRASRAGHDAAWGWEANCDVAQMDHPIRLQAHFVEPPANPESTDLNVTHVTVRAEVTDGFDFDDQSTSPGMLVVIEPRNQDGDYVALGGALSVVVLDGNRDGAAARVGRWDFDAAAARRRIRESSRGRGIHLVLPWNGLAPDSDQLHMFVRYTNVEGKVLEADTLLTNGKSIDRWSRPAAENRMASASVGLPPQQFRTRSMDTGRAPRVVNPMGFPLQPIPSSKSPSSSSSVSTASYSPNAADAQDGFTTQPIVDDGSRPTAKPSVSGRVARPVWRPNR